jgi:hypothetical protein
MSVTELQSETEALPSDAGGVAARRGFKYQDHVAALFVLKMIEDARLARVECETADDILLAWKNGAAEAREYVQVKTTEADRKWSQSEIVTRERPKTATSLVEKSLLCDVTTDGALFRIVSRRDVIKSLACLKLALDNRHRVAPAAELGKKLAQKWNTKSPMGRDLAYWARNAVWQVTGDAEALAALNHKTITILAERFGTNPTASHVKEIYDDLLRLVSEAGEASRADNPDKKVIPRDAAVGWWQNHLQETDAAQRRTSKPYRARTEPFFAELHSLSEADVRRALSSFDARYEQNKWRSLQLADHLADWLPEIALKASDLVSVQHLQLRQKTKDAIQTIKRHRAVAVEQLMAETMLHALIRQTHGSEPIACKLFCQSSTGLQSFGNAHIVHSTDGDTLWLGRAVVATAATHDEVIKKTVAELEHVLQADFLKEERETILALREPQHLLPTSLEATLSRNAPIDDLVGALCIPVLVGYDSKVLSGGYADGYQRKLVEEVVAAYEGLKPRLPEALKAVKVHVFLIPIECVKTLTDQFSALVSVS